MMDYDFLAIGDTVIDAFIRLKEASVHCDVNHAQCEICMKFGDKIPYEDVFVVPAVGNSANAAVAASRLGLKSALYSNVGDDEQGKVCLEVLGYEGVATDFVHTNPGKKTNYHYVLWYEDDRTILIKHEPYAYVLPAIGAPRWMYFSSVGEEGASLHDEVEKYLAAHPDVRLAFQPGTFQIRLGEKLKGLYARSEVMIANKEEFGRILNSSESDPKKLLEAMKQWGPKMVLMTDGPRGAYMMSDEGAFYMPIYPDPKPPYERTGAGDAFASTFVAALGLGLSTMDALRYAPVNPMSVVQYVGAQEGLLTREQLEVYLANAPTNYMPTPLP